MIHVLDDVTRYSDATDPLRAIAFHEDAVRAMAGSARLEVEVIEHGTWTGEAAGSSRILSSSAGRPPTRRSIPSQHGPGRQRRRPSPVTRCSR